MAVPYDARNPVRTLNDYFDGLSGTIPKGDVIMTGAWTRKVVRRYASESQSGTGEGPFGETDDWRWDGSFEAAFPVAGLAMLLMDQELSWVKSNPPEPLIKVSISAHGWLRRTSSVMVSGSLHGAVTHSVLVRMENEPPATCVIGPKGVALGVPHVVARVGDIVFAVVLLPGSILKIGRNRLWRLRAEIAPSLAAHLQQLLTRGRAGQLDL